MPECHDYIAEEGRRYSDVPCCGFETVRTVCAARGTRAPWYNASPNPGGELSTAANRKVTLRTEKLPGPKNKHTITESCSAR